MQTRVMGGASPRFYSFTDSIPFAASIVGLEQGWFPKDIRPYVGMCRTLMAQQGFEALPTTAVFTAFPSPWMTGGAGAGTIAADQQASYGTWPPQSINIIGAAATNLLTYTPTGTPITLSGTTPTAYPAAATKTVAPGNGWANAADTAPANAPVAGCVSEASRMRQQCHLGSGLKKS